ncbi:hypothetical protein OJF2_08510 [Aquisphaera giovannonii]|uniref:Uncharacterized protein n=1 Tax=Aquisphaera giovannonii TaxID=406548 RepID=A0A5B9VWY2_9BACT|nr:hypothetical protein OJF2_08510 [Aquisphaera giovannonii]
MAHGERDALARPRPLYLPSYPPRGAKASDHRRWDRREDPPRARFRRPTSAGGTDSPWEPAPSGDRVSR